MRHHAHYSMMISIILLRVLTFIFIPIVALIIIIVVVIITIINKFTIIGVIVDANINELDRFCFGA